MKLLITNTAKLIFIDELGVWHKKPFKNFHVDEEQVFIQRNSHFYNNSGTRFVPQEAHHDTTRR